MVRGQMSGADVGDAAAEAAMPLAGADDSAANLRGVKRARPTGPATPGRGRARTSGWMAREMRGTRRRRWLRQDADEQWRI